MAAEEPQQQKQEPLGSDSEGVNCLAYDEAIMAQQDRIQQEIAVQNPLVSERLELSVLYKEYAEDDNIYQQKIKDLHKKYSYIRKTRPDGNCFYRAFGFSHLEALLDDSKELQRFKAVSAKSKEDLVSQGFTEFTIEDFHNTFMDLIEQVEKQTSVADLLASFNDQSTSDYLVVYLRLLTSGYLQRESKFFEHFIEGGRTVKEFCQQEVEPMCKESDHIHIIALAQALSVSIQGMLVVSRVCACPCSAACPAAVCPAVPALPQVGSSWPSTCPHPSLPTRSSFEGARPLGDPPLVSCSLLFRHPSPFPP
ncbi:ubiquitin thioesterase OTUB1 isoform X2 [Neomonachus schauinslandi]|uniref:ubiquitinyl hydrolase 1 n=1 Tax=Neomonachus schauinslandi TaxID=29088 RepID=A0A2Y9GVA6_NEOSC|nr:ubiquitin thioesterase OTUB1 isoform X2 [Neomonachus schauinslandi]